MRLPIVLAIFRKDLLDAVRDSRILVSLLTPLVLALLYNTMFPDERIFTAKVAYVGPETSALVATLRERAGQTVDLDLRHVGSADEARAAVVSEDVDVAFVLPDDVDEAIRGGRPPRIVVLVPPTGGAPTNFVTGSLAAGARALAGQAEPITLETEEVQVGTADEGVLGEVGPRRYFVLATIVMMLGMTALLAVPIILTEEAERRTLDALLLVASYGEVIVGKALVGVAYTVVSVAIMLGLTRLLPADLPTFIAGTGLLAIALIGFGLLLGGLFRTASQVYTWSSVLLFPVIGPAFVAGLPMPPAVDLVLRALPTSQAMRPMTNGLAGEALFSDVWLSYLVVGAWAVVAYALLAWRLRRRES